MAGSAAATQLFLSNLWFWQNSGEYFDGATDHLPLLHTWSLAVEKQFYILFPLILLFLVNSGRRVTLAVTTLTFLASLVLAVWALPRVPSASFYLLLTRIWELAAGSALALGVAPAGASRAAVEGVALMGLAAILWAIFTYRDTIVFPGAAALVPVLVATNLIWSGGIRQTFVARALSLRRLVIIGLLSYSLYLWHWPVMAFGRNRLINIDLAPAWQLGTIALSLVLSWLYWRFIERVFRGRGVRKGNHGEVFAASGLGACVLGAAALAVVAASGAELRYTPERRTLLSSLDINSEIRDCRGARSPADLSFFGDMRAEWGGAGCSRGIRMRRPSSRLSKLWHSTLERQSTLRVSPAARQRLGLFDLTEARFSAIAA